MTTHPEIPGLTSACPLLWRPPRYEKFLVPPAHNGVSFLLCRSGRSNDHASHCRPRQRQFQGRLHSHGCR